MVKQKLATIANVAALQFLNMSEKDGNERGITGLCFYIGSLFVPLTRGLVVRWNMGGFSWAHAGKMTVATNNDTTIVPRIIY